MYLTQNDRRCISGITTITQGHIKTANVFHITANIYSKVGDGKHRVRFGGVRVVSSNPAHSEV